MKKIVLLFLLFSPLIFAQNRQIDSLNEVLQTFPEMSIERVRAFNELAYWYHLVDPKIGLVKSQEALKLAIHIEDKEQQALAYKYMGYNYKALSQDSLALITYDRAIEIQRELNDWKQVGIISYNKGLLHSDIGNFRKALESQNLAYSMFERNQDSLLMSVALNGKGVNQMFLSMYPEAIETYNTASSLLEKIGRSNTGLHADAYSNLGLVYRRLEKIDLALSYYDKSLEINKKLQRDEPIANLLSSIGNIYDDLEQPQKAIDFYNQSLTIMLKIGDTYGIASAYTNIGVTNISLNKLDKALSFLGKAKPLLESINDNYNLSLVHDNIGDAYREKSKATGKKPLLLKAKENYQTSLNYANKINAFDRKAKAYQHLSEVNRTLNNFKEAYLQQQKAIQFKDSVALREKKEEIAKLEATFEYEKKELELKADFEKTEAIKETEIAKQKLIGQIYLGSGIVILIVIGITIYLSNQKRKIKAVAKENAFKKNLAESKLIALRTQLNPHFIFNAMSSIENYMSTHSPEEASTYLIKFSALMRRILQNSEKNWITLQEEIDLMKVYVEIESLRLKNPIQLSIDISEHIDIENTLVPSLFIQPFIENSIEHGISKKEDSGVIRIQINEQEDQLSCTVEDNGIGRHESLSKNSNYTSMGMKIAKERVNYINQLTQNNSFFEIEDLTEGVKVTITIPHKTLF